MRARDTESGSYPRSPEAARCARTAGRKLWRAICKDWELDARELAILDRAARQADVNDALEKAIRLDGYWHRRS